MQSTRYTLALLALAIGLASTGAVRAQPQEKPPAIWTRNQEQSPNKKSPAKKPSAKPNTLQKRKPAEVQRANHQDPPPEKQAESQTQDQDIEPKVLRTPKRDEEEEAEQVEYITPRLRYPVDPPPGFAGPSSVEPSEEQLDDHFVPMEDRWRVGLPEWDRNQHDHPLDEDYPYSPGDRWNPYRQNVLKGDYPILGQHNFLNLTAATDQIIEARQLPTPNTPFESNPHPGDLGFFGDPDQFFYNNNMIVSADWVHGDGAFKPADWRFKVTNIFNVNHLVVDELGVVRPDVRAGTARGRFDYALEEWFFESKLADLGPNYDFISARAGSQFFTSDFRGFIFADTNRAVRIFGSRLENRDQFNIMWLDQTEKDTNSLLNTFNDRGQNTVIVNYYRQDFIVPGYTIQGSYHYNRDDASFFFDQNGNLARPDPAGVAAPHRVDAHYIGFAGDGHIGRFNINHAFYIALGHDQLNPIAGQPVDIYGKLGALELSYDRDWMRFKTSYFYTSGDGNASDGRANGFDAPFENPNFAGGQFSFWQRQNIRLLGVGLVQRFGLIPDLRSSKFEGQTNFVNPGLHLLNFGVDADITPKLKSINNMNFLWFDQTEVLETFVFQPNISPFIGVDLSTGMEYRPRLNNNVIITGGVSALIPGGGFHDLYDNLDNNVNTLMAGFMNVVLAY